jgi:hypothetical protein
MEQGKVEQALARIEAAAARIEAASTRAPSDADPDLAIEHARLKGSVAASLRELDSLIAALEQ